MLAANLREGMHTMVYSVLGMELGKPTRKNIVILHALHVEN